NRCVQQIKPLAATGPKDKNLVTAIGDGPSAVQPPAKSSAVPGAPEKKDEKKEEAKPSSDAAGASAAGTTPKDGEKKEEKEGEKKDDKPKEEKKEEEKKEELDASTKNRPYPVVKDPTPSEIEKKKQALEKEKQEKIANGDYQKKSDEDDTLEKVKSLKEEQSEKSGKKRKK
ncbi:hypothetical protein PFISCL1PPCAC_16167, partial [Pristionchus fissidentatus]